MKEEPKGLIPLTLFILSILTWWLLPPWTERLISLESAALESFYGVSSSAARRALVLEEMNPVVKELEAVATPTAPLNIPPHLVTSIQQWIERCLVIMDLWPILGMILCVAALDVEADRLIRLTNFSYPSPIKHRMTRSLLTGYLQGLFLSLVVPWPWPPGILEALWLSAPLVIHLHLRQAPKRR